MSLMKYLRLLGLSEKPGSLESANQDAKEYIAEIKLANPRKANSEFNKTEMTQMTVADELAVDLDIEKNMATSRNALQPVSEAFFSERVFLVAGHTFNNKDGGSRQQIISQLGPRDILNLKREPFNEYDGNAIRVLAGRGQIGYLPRAMAAVLRNIDLNVIAIQVESIGKSGNTLSCFVRLRIKKADMSATTIARLQEQLPESIKVYSDGGKKHSASNHYRDWML